MDLGVGVAGRMDLGVGVVGRMDLGDGGTGPFQDKSVMIFGYGVR